MFSVDLALFDLGNGFCVATHPRGGLQIPRVEDLRSNVDTREFNTRVFLFFGHNSAPSSLFRDHIKTDPSYHHPGPPYTYQDPQFKH